LGEIHSRARVTRNRKKVRERGDETPCMGRAGRKYSTNDGRKKGVAGGRENLRETRDRRRTQCVRERYGNTGGNKGRNGGIPASMGGVDCQER